MKRLAYATFGVSSVLILGALVALALSFEAPATGFGFRGWSPAFAISFVVVGVVITTNRSDNAIGWAFAGLGLIASVLAVCDEYSFYGIEHVVPARAWAAWVGEWLWVPLNGGIFVFVPLIFPNGHLLSPRWRWVILLAGVGAVAGGLRLALVPGALAQSPEYTNPAGLAFAASPTLIGVGDFGLSLLTLSVGLGVVSIVVRLRRSQSVERQQIKWLAFVVAIAAITTLIYLPFAVTGSIPPKLLDAVITSTIIAVPVCIGLAVMRYRLYDIDRIISRTVSYAIVSAVLTGTFAAVALLPTVIIGAGGPTSDWMIVLGTLAVAAVFRPVRRRVQDVVDHRFNRRRYDSQRTVDAFGARLREQLDIDALGAELCAVVKATMQPSHVSLWLSPKK